MLLLLFITSSNTSYITMFVLRKNKTYKFSILSVLFFNITCRIKYLNLNNNMYFIVPSKLFTFCHINAYEPGVIITFEFPNFLCIE